MSYHSKFKPGDLYVRKEIYRDSRHIKIVPYIVVENWGTDDNKIKIVRQEFDKRFFYRIIAKK